MVSGAHQSKLFTIDQLAQSVLELPRQTDEDN